MAIYCLWLYLVYLELATTSDTIITTATSDTIITTATSDTIITTATNDKY